MPTELRIRRIAERIRLELSDLLQRDVSDPRLALVTVTDVRVDRELAVANVWVCSVGEEAREQEVMKALDRAKGFLRHEVAQQMELRTMPQLKFHWDPSPERGERISQLLDSLATETPSTPAGEPETEPSDE